MPRSSTECDIADGGGTRQWMVGLGADRMALKAAYTHEVEFALLAACLRSPLAVDEAGQVIDAHDFLEPACGRLWSLIILARIECSTVDDDRLRQALADLDEADIERIVDRLRHPLVKPNLVLKFAKDVRRLAAERRA